MTPPAATASASLRSSPGSALARRLVLVPAEPPTDRSDAGLRRYRLARLRLEGRAVPASERFAHCRRGYD